MNFDLEMAKFALVLANAVGTLAVAAYTFVATRDKDNSQHIKAVETALTKAISGHATRIDKVETAMQYMPTPQQMSDLKGDMQGMQAKTEALLREINTIRLTTGRIEDYLLNK